MYKTDAAVWLILGGFVVAWFLVDGCLIPPDFGQTDIYYFKEAGINFAQGLGLTTRFTYGNPTLAYRDYAHYPPLYPLLFGLYAKAAGVSALSNQAFNSLVAILIGTLGFFALRPVIHCAVGDRYTGPMAVAVGMASIAGGFYGFPYDRPDGLAVALGLGALMLALRGSSRGSALTAGVLCALALFTSPFAGIFTSLAVSIGLCALAERPLTHFLRRVLHVGIGGAAAVALILGLLLKFLPGWFDGFFGVASGSATNNETGSGYFLALLRGDIGTWWSGFSYTSPVAFLSPLKLGAAVVALAWMLALKGGGDNRRIGSLIALIVASLLCFLIAPYQSNYPPMTAALLLTAWAAVEFCTTRSGHRASAVAILAVFALNFAMTAPLAARGLLVRSTAGESMRRALAYLDAHRGDFDIRGEYVAVSPSNYILWRQAGLHPLINIYSGFKDPTKRESVRFLALSYPGSGDPVQPQPAEFFPKREYILIAEPKLPQRAIAFGRRLLRSSQTWESAIYARRPCEDCPLADQGPSASAKLR